MGEGVQKVSFQSARLRRETKMKEIGVSKTIRRHFIIINFWFHVMLLGFGIVSFLRSAKSSQALQDHHKYQPERQQSF